MEGKTVKIFRFYLDPDNKKARSQEQDTAKFLHTNCIRLARLSIENQTKAEKYMPMRMISYDGAAYRSQLTAENKDVPKYPVISLVLHFDYKKDWDQPTRLKECFGYTHQSMENNPTINLSADEKEDDTSKILN